ncbi:radical SAM protein [Blautia schinkii]|nr:radical SAM protein [Blautia schinkii]
MKNEKIFKPFIPGVLINLTDCCNFKCKYCPPYGENLCKGMDKYDEDAILLVISLSKKYGIKQVRLTGGEPFLESQRLQLFLNACGDSFERLVLNTNGSLLKKNLFGLKKYKKNITLKISLDTLNENNFNNITQSNSFLEVYDNILSAISEQFKIELNAVLYNQTFEEICDLVEFSVNNQIDLKFLTTSTFYGNVSFKKSVLNMKKVVEYLENQSSFTSKERLVGERGAPMLVYHIEKSKITIFDSCNKNSLTPLKCYFDCCENECHQYPCDYGAFSIGISTDGLMSICRGRKDLGKQIFYQSSNEIESAFVNQVERFKSCFSINVNSL